MRNNSANPGTGGRPAGLMAAVVCAVAGVVLFQFYGNSTLGYIKSASLFQWWTSQWMDPMAESEHGWLILGLSGWLLWRNLQQPETPGAQRPTFNSELSTPNARLHTSDAITAAAAMLAGLLLHAVGFAAQQARVSIVALLVFTWGALRLGGGRRWGEAALFPVGFMVFAIPINVLDSAGFWLRMWVIEASAGLAGLAGIAVLRSGTQLVAPDGSYNYDVAAACSGVRSLTALTALSLLMGYLSFRSWWRRTLVLLLCFPLVYLGNVARISAIIFAAEIGGPVWGDRAHEVMGYGVFGIVLGGVLGGVTLLQHWWPERKKEERGRKEGNGAHVTGAREVSPRGSSVVAVAVVVLALGEGMFLHHLANSPERGAAGVALAPDGLNPVELPAFLGTDWIGRRTEVTPVEREILPADTGFSRKVYVSLADAKREVLLSIVLSGRDRTSIHRPELCLVGQGWTIAGAVSHEFRFPGSMESPAGRFPATVLQIEREVASPRGTVRIPQVAAYWFVDSGTVVATHWQRIARDAWNRVTRARADRWAYVLMQTDASDGDAAALARMQQVLDETLPVFLGVGILAAPKP